MGASSNLPAILIDILNFAAHLLPANAAGHEIGHMLAAPTKRLWPALARLGDFRGIDVSQPYDHLADRKGVAIDRLGRAGDDFTCGGRDDHGKR